LQTLNEVAFYPAKNDASGNFDYWHKKWYNSKLAETEPISTPAKHFNLINYPAALRFQDFEARMVNRGSNARQKRF
jgi:hypothetical protein